jgi:bacillopeptidase F (M6 metalloprotease family)
VTKSFLQPTWRCSPGSGGRCSAEADADCGLNGVTPAYSSSNLAGEAAWVGVSPGWVEHVVDLSAYAGQTIDLRYAVRTDFSVQNAGEFIDSLQIVD